MDIRKEVLEAIRVAANRESSEVGGILGSAEKGVVTDIVVDVPEKTAGCRFEYHPDTAFFNAQIEKWAEEDIEFVGIFHAHFSGSRNLSEADQEYIRSIMDSARGITDHLFFPVFTLPDNVLTVYKACFSGSEVVIREDELRILSAP